MSRIRGPGSIHVNTAANFVSQFLGPASGLLLVPVFLHFMDLDALGLIGLLGALQATLGIFTRGLGWSLQREIAQAGAADDRTRVRALLRTFERGYLAIGLVIGALLALLAGPVSRFIADDAPAETIRRCLLLVALRIAIAFPSSVYQAVLLGLRRHVLVNVVNSGLLLFGVATQIVLIAATRSVVWLYVGDVINAVATMALMSRIVRTLPEYATAEESRLLSRAEVKSLGALSAGLMWVHGTGMWIKQLDRFVVFGATSLSSLAVYTAGAAGGKLVALAYNPYLTAVFPETCAVAARDRSALPAHLTRNSKVVALLSLGIGVPVALSATELLTLWTHNSDIVSGGARVLVVYAVAAVFQSLMSAQMQAFTAIGSTKCQVWFNGAAAVWLWPATSLLVGRYGIVGAAYAWLLYCASGWVVYTIVAARGPLRGGLRGYLRALTLTAAIITSLDYLLSRGAHALDGDRDLVYVAVMAAGSVVVLLGAAVASLGRDGLVGLLPARLRQPTRTTADNLTSTSAPATSVSPLETMVNDG